MILEGDESMESKTTKPLPTAQWQEIRSQEDAELLLSPTRAFHDAVFRIALLNSGSHVDTEFRAIDETYASLWSLVQTQRSALPAFEIFFEEIERAEYQPRVDADGRIEFSPEGWEVVMGGWKILCRRLFFRLGTAKDLGSYPPVLEEAIYLHISAKSTGPSETSS